MKNCPGPDPVAVLRRFAALTAALLVTCDAPGPPSGNRAPSAPIVSGPSEVLVGELAEFSVEAYDPDGNSLRIFIAWGDGDTSDYGEFVLPGQAVYFEHRYLAADTFYIRARCHDFGPLFSEWSGPRRVVATSP